MRRNGEGNFFFTQLTSIPHHDELLERRIDKRQETALGKHLSNLNPETMLQHHLLQKMPSIRDKSQMEIKSPGLRRQITNLESLQLVRNQLDRTLAKERQRRTSVLEPKSSIGESPIEASSEFNRAMEKNPNA